MARVDKHHPARAPVRQGQTRGTSGVRLASLEARRQPQKAGQLPKELSNIALTSGRESAEDVAVNSDGSPSPSPKASKSKGSSSRRPPEERIVVTMKEKRGKNRSYRPLDEERERRQSASNGCHGHEKV